MKARTNSLIHHHLAVKIALNCFLKYCFTEVSCHSAQVIWSIPGFHFNPSLPQTIKNNRINNGKERRFGDIVTPFSSSNAME